MKWRVILEPDLETGELAVWCLELPGCVFAGETEQEDQRKYSLWRSPFIWKPIRLN